MYRTVRAKLVYCNGSHKTILNKESWAVVRAVRLKVSLVCGKWRNIIRMTNEELDVPAVTNMPVNVSIHCNVHVHIHCGTVTMGATDVHDLM